MDKKDEKVFSTEELFGKEKQILIRHGEALYRLLITRQGKLVLNK
ncbi:MAG: hemin uptake protein HemP [Candidatus Omnitrophica bacterium]|nr:hemin uptake protein HemP [Candidatus Omnitrophota bacterium]